MHCYDTNHHPGFRMQHFSVFTTLITIRNRIPRIPHHHFRSPFGFSQRPSSWRQASWAPSGSPFSPPSLRAAAVASPPGGDAPENETMDNCTNIAIFHALKSPRPCLPVKTRKMSKVHPMNSNPTTYPAQVIMLLPHQVLHAFLFIIAKVIS